jgi:hypothetical protein
MRRLGFALLIAALCAAPASAAEAPPLCKALRALGDEARRSGEPQRISAGVDFSAPADCRPVTDNAATRSFCGAASQEGGLAWRIHGCVDTMAAETQVTTRGEHAEGRTRKAIAHLTAGLAHGVRLDLEEAGGRYDIVVWSPK